jgi:protein-tyrosine phosphatase
MDVFQIDDHGLLFISPDIDSWQSLTEQGISVVFDLDDDLDVGIPCMPNQLIYLFFPFEDKPTLPDPVRLHALAQLGANLIGKGHRVLTHCGMGHNRSALLAGIILTYLGWSGADAVTRLRERRPGALYNKVFAAYLAQLESAVSTATG